MRTLFQRVPWQRFLTVALGVTAIVTVSYLVAANVLLRSRLLRNAVSGASLNFALRGNSTALLVEYESAYSLFPGRIHVEGLRLRGRERTLEWLLTIEHADVAVSLGDLLRRRFHATRVRASGLALRLRPRLARADATPDVVAALPPIAGFADPPLLDSGPAPPLLTDANYDLWTVELENVDVEHVREAWIQAWRSRGDTHVRGRLLFRPQRGLEVGPVTVDANGVDFFYGRLVLATGLRGSLGATLHPFDLRQTKGLAIFDHVSYDGRLRGHAIIAEVLRLVAPRRGIDFKQCEGPVDGRVVLIHGKLAHGTRVLTEAPNCEVEVEGLTFRAPLRAGVAVDQALGSVEAHLSDLRVSRGGVEQARVASLGASVKSRRLELARGFFGDLQFSLEIGAAETNDIGLWKRFLPSESVSELVVRSGKVTLRVHVDGSLVEGGAWAEGSGVVAADDVTVRFGRGILRGKLAARVELRRGTWETRTFDFSGSRAALSTVSAQSASGGVAVLTVPSLTLEAPRLVFAPSGEDAHLALDLPRVDLVDLGALSRLFSLPPELDVYRGEGDARFHADVELPSWSMRGDAEVALRNVRARVGSTKVFGDLVASLKAQRPEGAESSTRFSEIKLAITRAGTGTRGSSEGAWWGNLILRDATLRTNGGLRFDAKAHARAKDARPATALVAENTGVPGFATNVLHMSDVDAEARVSIRPGSFEVRSLVAHGGTSSLRAEYAKTNGRTDGAALLDLGWISVGYDFSDGATGLVLIGAEDWFGRRTASMRDGAGSAEETPDASEQLVGALAR